MQIKTIIDFALPALLKHKTSTFIALALLLSTTILSVLSVEASRSVVQAIQINISPETPADSLYWLSNLGVSDPKSLFYYAAIATVTLPLITHIAKYFQYLVFEWVAVQVTKEIRVAIFDRVLKFPYLQFLDMEIGTLVKRVSNDAKDVRGFILEAVLMRVADIFFVIGLLIYLFTLNGKLLVVTALCLTFYLAGSILSAKIATKALRQSDKSFEEITSRANEVFSRFIDVKVNCREDYEVRKFTLTAENNAKKSIKTVKNLLLDRSITGILQAAGPTIIVFTGGMMTINNDMSFSTLMAFVAGTTILYGPVNNLSAIPLLIARSSIAAENISSILNLNPEAGIDSKKTIAKPDISQTDPILTIQNLQFSYPKSHNSLHIKSLEAKKGEMIALVGPSGSGKSSLLKILFGLLNDYKGDIFYNTVNLREIPVNKLRRTISFMPQDSCILPTSIFENVGYGLGDHDANEAETWNALGKAGLKREVEAMPDTIQTQLDTFGQKVSGGQKRRLCLSRALIKAPEILILDEPLTGIAPQDRNSILQNIVANKGDMCIFLTTHQSDLLQHADKIIFLHCENSGNEDGGITTRIKAIGTHSELINTCPEYSHEFNYDS